LGRLVSIPAFPQRIISLAPSNTEILFALGLGERVIGVTEQCDYPKEAANKPKIGTFFKPSLEKIVELQPDLVLGKAIHSPDLLLQLERVGIKVILLEPHDISGIISNIQLVGKVTGREERATYLTQYMKGRKEEIATKVKGAPKPTVFYIIDATTDPAKPWTTGSGTFIDVLINLAGGKNIAAVGKGWLQFSLEELLRADPQIILVDTVHGLPISLEELRKRPIYKELTAVKRGAVYEIDGNLTSRPGPRIIEGLEMMAKLLHPESFKEGR